MIKTEEDMDRYIKEHNISNFYVYLAYVNYGTVLGLAQHFMQAAYILTDNRPYKVSSSIKEMSKAVINAIKSITAASLNITEADSLYAENKELKLQEEQGAMWLNASILPAWAAYILKKGDKLRDDEVPDVSKEEQDRLCKVFKPIVDTFKDAMARAGDRCTHDCIDRFKIKNKGYAGLYAETQRLSKAHHKIKNLASKSDSEVVRNLYKKPEDIFNKIV